MAASRQATLLLLAAMVRKAQGWRRTTVVLLNGNTFTCSMVQLYHGLRLNSKRDQERIQR